LTLPSSARIENGSSAGDGDGTLTSFGFSTGVTIDAPRI
jgi:hypothetical protein